MEHDIAPILTAIALMLNAIPAIIAAVAASRAAKIVAKAAVQINEVHEAVNSKMDKLLDVTKTSSHAEGVLEGKLKSKEEQ